MEIIEPGEVNRMHVRSWLASMMEEEYQPASVHRKLSALHSYYRFLVKNGLAETNPVKGLVKPKIPKRLPVYVEEKPALRMYELAGEEGSNLAATRDQLIVALFYETGVRLSELIGLEDKAIDSHLLQLRILGKRNKVRFVPVSSSLMVEIQRFQKLKVEAGFGNQAGTLLVSDSGKKLSRTFVYLRVKNYLSQVSTLKKRSPHVLRHTFATHMLNNGADLNVIKEVLGHSSLAATQVYTHNSVEKLKRIHSGLHPRNKK